MKEPTFVKYQRIPHLAEDPRILDGENLQVFEKLDGGNSQVRNVKGRILCGSRANFLKRKENFSFEWFEDFHRWAMSNKSFYALPENLIVYGEFTAPHTIPYRPEFTNQFFLIDLYDTNTRRFIPYAQAREILEEKIGIRDLSFLSPLTEGKVDFSLLGKLALGESEYSLYGREGVVIKDYSAQKFAKLWRTSVNKSKEGLFEEITKTINSINATSHSKRRSNGFDGMHLSPSDKLVGQVYRELKRSGRLDISVSEIYDTIQRVLNKN